ncbi:MAG: hypothetical protein QM777_20875 [Pseudorhodoferax sp.]
MALIDHLSASPPEQGTQWLLLNGDVFDFLQIPGYDGLSLPLAPQRMQAILDSLDKEPPERNVPQALRRFTARGNLLCCLPGNHDAELNLATVQQVLEQRLGSHLPWPATAGHWRMQAAGHTVVGLHGHHEDAFNAIGGAQMQRAQADGDATVPMPPGSRLVCEVINPFRRAKNPDGGARFPFIDRLPSEMAVVLAIMLLDPRLVGKRLHAALGIGASALLRKALRGSGLAGPTLAAQAAHKTVASDWLGQLTQHLAAAASGADDGAGPVQIGQLEHALEAYSPARAWGMSGRHRTWQVGPRPYAVCCGGRWVAR